MQHRKTTKAARKPQTQEATAMFFPRTLLLRRIRAKRSTPYLTQREIKRRVVVNEWLTNKNGAKEISDTSDLKDIKNTSGNQKFTKDGDKVNMEGRRF